MKPYEVFNHTADIGLRARGKTLKEAFENAARGMFSLIVSPEEVKRAKKRIVEIKAKDRESLLVEWLNELLYLFEAEELVFADFKIDGWDSKRWLKANVYGERIDLKRHQIEAQIKACTYHMLKIERNKLWEIQIIFDV